MAFKKHGIRFEARCMGASFAGREEQNWANFCCRFFTGVAQKWAVLGSISDRRWERGPVQQYSMQTHMETGRWAWWHNGKDQFALDEYDALCLVELQGHNLFSVFPCWLNDWFGQVLSPVNQSESRNQTEASNFVKSQGLSLSSRQCQTTHFETDAAQTEQPEIWCSNSSTVFSWYLTIWLSLVPIIAKSFEWGKNWLFGCFKKRVFILRIKTAQFLWSGHPYAARMLETDCRKRWRIYHWLSTELCLPNHCVTFTLKLRMNFCAHPKQKIGTLKNWRDKWSDMKTGCWDSEVWL